MLPNLYIDQMTLAPWAGKIDLIDAALIALVRSLNPDQSDEVKRRMFGKYFLLQSSFIRDMIPFYDGGKNDLSNRVAKLVRLGLLDRHPLTKKARTMRYVKLSRFYFQAERRANRIADRALSLARVNTSLPEGQPIPPGGKDHKEMIIRRSAVSNDGERVLNSKEKDRTPPASLPVLSEKDILPTPPQPVPLECPGCHKPAAEIDAKRERCECGYSFFISSGRYFNILRSANERLEVKA